MTPDLTATYLGLTLRSPLVPSASPRSELVSNVERMAEAGAGAVVFHSLFAEQLEPGHADDFKISPEEYCRHITTARQHVSIPLIASMNATVCGSWLDAARRIEDAGAHAIELNLYHGPEVSSKTSAQIEEDAIETVRRLTKTVTIPVAVKLTPYYTNLFHLARDFEFAGARGLVLFTRFSVPDPGALHGRNFLTLPLSSPVDMQLPMHWIAVLSRRLGVSLAATGGIQRSSDVIRMIMAGADIAMICSVLLRRGISYLAELERGLVEWMNELGYSRIGDFQKCLSFPPESEPGITERKNYIRLLTHSEHALNSLAQIERRNGT